MQKQALSPDTPQRWDTGHIGSLMVWQSEVVTEVINLQQAPEESIESYWNRAATLQTKLRASQFVSADTLVVDCFIDGLRPALRNPAVPARANPIPKGLRSVLLELKTLSRILPEASTETEVSRF